ncbi:MAG: hypothetical protein K8J09_02780 [Planctomycetes bacterium]|nr:hypothetical protein [Planctomycetota bacterium]
MSTWKAIRDEEFDELFQEQYRDLTPEARAVFERYRVPFWKATIRRPESAGDEHVFVVAQSGDGILYFDDVEYGFNISTVDDEGTVLHPGASQATLAEAVEDWFPSSG